MPSKETKVRIHAMEADITTADVDAIVVNLFEGVTKPGGATGAIDKILRGAITDLIADQEFSGKRGQISQIRTLGNIPAKRVVIVGLGKQSLFNAHVVREVSGAVARYLRRVGVRKAASIAHGSGIGGMNPTDSALAMAEGTLLGLYEFKQYKSKKADAPDSEFEDLLILEADPNRLSAIEQGIARGTIMANAVIIARDLVNEPANVVNPVKMAQKAKEIAKDAGLGITILSREDMIENAMGAMLAVTAGSANEPQLIVLEYRGDPSHPDNNIAIVGKGITFDSGGISLKPSASMWEMKGDMSGGASVIGAMQAIASIAPPINVFGVVPAVENMPSGTAQRPGDIIRAMNGKTIEVDNTDAEGRLVLADAISYISMKRGAKRVVDIATLTGAVVVALGHVATGVMGTSQGLVDAILSASKVTGEKMWQLPLFDEYKRQNRSEYADVKNTGGRPAGSITAALFIGEFTEGLEWAHLDIAGTFLAERTTGHLVKGASGVPTRTLITLVEALAAPQ